MFNQVYQKKSEKEKLDVQLEELKAAGETLKVEVNKLQDAEYIAKYAREKYLYSASGEYIIRIK